MSRSGDFRGDDRQTDRQTDYFTPAHAHGVIIYWPYGKSGIGDLVLVILSVLEQSL